MAVSRALDKHRKLGHSTAEMLRRSSWSGSGTRYSLALRAVRYTADHPQCRIERFSTGFFNDNIRDTLPNVEPKYKDHTTAFIQKDHPTDANGLYRQIQRAPGLMDPGSLALTDTSAGITRRCSVGSFIETQSQGESDCGIVTESQNTLFEGGHLGMVNWRGEQRTAEPNDITFHIPGSLSTIHNPAESATQIVKASSSIIPRVRRALHVFQAHLSQQHTSTHIDIEHITDAIHPVVGKHHSRPFVKCAIHMCIQRSPLDWRMDRDYGRKDSIRLMTSPSVPFVTYIMNSVELSETLRCVSRLNGTTVNWFRSVVGALKEDGGGNRAIAELQKHKQEASDIIDFLKYFSQYPHPDLTVTVRQLLGEAYEATRVGVSNALCDLHQVSPLFDSEPLLEPVQLVGVNDNFNHIRFTNTVQAYALPSEVLSQAGLSNCSELALSLEKKEEVYILNIHIPDVGSYIDQNHKQLRSLLERTTDIDAHNEMHSLFHPSTVGQLAFSPNKTNTCLTISIRYPHTEDRPWYKTTSSVRLERLLNLKFVPLADLNELWRSKFPVISNLFNIFMPSDSYEVLNAKDKADLMSVFSMIDYWFLKRGNECSMEQVFERMKPNQETMDGVEKNEDKEMEFLKYLIQELKLIVAEHLLKYQEKHKVPLVMKTQGVIEPLGDTFPVKNTESLVIPDYEATSFEELTFYKNSKGVTPMRNFIGAGYFLEHVEISTTNQSRFASLGLPRGLVEICDPLHDMESVLNQWQIVSHLQSQFKESQENFKMGLKKIFMVKYKLMPPEELRAYYMAKIHPVKENNKRISSTSYRAAVLAMLRERVEQQDNFMNWSIFKCVILSPPQDALASAYCLDLDLDVLVRLPECLPSVKIGDQLICSRLDSITLTDVILQA